MTKVTLRREVQRELERLNTSIDRKILKGQPFTQEARRHKELLLTLRRMDGDTRAISIVRRRLLRAVSPARRSLNGGVAARLFTFRVAY